MDFRMDLTLVTDKPTLEEAHTRIKEVIAEILSHKDMDVFLGVNSDLPQVRVTA